MRAQRDNSGDAVAEMPACSEPQDLETWSVIDTTGNDVVHRGSTAISAILQLENPVLLRFSLATTSCLVSKAFSAMSLA